jgi:hypothetical protein
MKTLEHIAAVVVFLVHCVVLGLLLFGWFVPELRPAVYVLATITLLQDIFLGYCILSRWEFSLRRMLNPKLRYNYTFTSYYTYKLTRQRIRTNFLRYVGIAYLGSFLLISLVFTFGGGAIG